MKAMFKHPITGEIKSLKVGFSWTCLFFSGFLGVPLWIRQLYTHATIMCATWVANFVLQSNMHNAYTISQRNESALLIVFLAIGSLIYSIWLGFNANELAAKNFLRNGWRLADPDSEISKYAATQWRINSIPTYS